jgi:hypothetical protein
VGQLDQRGTVGEDLALVDVTLVGDLAGVKARPAGYSTRTLIPGISL